MGRARREDLPSKYEITKKIVHRIFQRLKEGRSSIDYEDYKALRKEVDETLMDQYHLPQHDKDTLREYFDRFFAVLSGFNIVVPRGQREDGAPSLKEGFDIGVTTPKIFPHEDSTPVAIIAGLATSPYRSEFPKEMIDHILESLGSGIVYPEEPAEEKIRFLIPALREAAVRRFAETVGERLAALAADIETKKAAGDDKGAYETLKVVRRYLGYCKKYDIPAVAYPA